MTFVPTRTRAPEEVALCLRTLSEGHEDPFGFVASVLAPHLDKRPTVDMVLEVMRQYLPFAFGKARDKRGISSARSIQHYRGWVWLICDTEAELKLQNWWGDEYGLDMLTWIADRYGWEVPE